MADKTPAENMLEALEGFKQLEELARGFRAHLEAGGWSETMAELIAANMLIEFQKKAINQ
jgi:hypothetical protein